MNSISRRPEPYNTLAINHGMPDKYLQYCFGLFLSPDDGELPRLFCPLDFVEPSNLLPEDHLVEKQDGTLAWFLWRPLQDAWLAKSDKN
jgi:hypothetical protein